ncbi:MULTISPECIES: hypothetical protein [Klebsiella pneumoniae complex]|uniref:hypothetical protein n=1 Tax=Klebsiella pneumoniae complex TaxID=3390273 RepID=UPI000808A940|nr:hypothetical protein [Klebsiella pneumoniae]HBQ5717275.1 hypothetical protein [Klebsiella pneumoniae subsp. pneumoniae]HBW1669636.1 hypothetical protein [Klebsiella quasipneumoniae subsp. similipneumoniae]HCM6480765.1 hypothetical protein [Klebsiella quasipneumoniae]MCD5868399.1 hypothetical protein [Klebsiella pneumoniae]MDP0617092.1 hypothetical protein [Klebsiella pneumoniae]
MPFPLEQWFDVTKKIDKYDLETSLDQIAVYGIKQGDVTDKEVRATQREMKAAVRAHNKMVQQC